MPLHGSGLPQREDRQVERNENGDHHDAHDDQDRRLDQGQRRGEGGLHVFFEELRYRVQHLGQRAGRFAHFNHLGGELGEDSGLAEASREAFAFADPPHRCKDGFGDAFARNGAGGGFKRWNQRQAAGEQGREGPGEERDLVLEPDGAEDWHADADGVDAGRPASVAPHSKIP